MNSANEHRSHPHPQTEPQDNPLAVLAPGLDELQDFLGYRFRDVGLLQLALTHPSVAHERNIAVQTNQRLQFLGDAVLQLALTGELSERVPAFGEGQQTAVR